jgi:alkanesulfonate monooxygenase SsuD/methylene tetrahydromethanopterin reductase-like flavin-dependent oxidoreductase (luciferase family)
LIISNGRLELGIGAGWNEEESGAYGIELGSIKERFDRFEEACEVLKNLLSQEKTTFDGKYYQLKDARNEPKGPQQPHPPICIGGSGEKRTLRITAKYADHWNFVGGPPAEFARKRDVLASHCADIGRDPKRRSPQRRCADRLRHRHRRGGSARQGGLGPRDCVLADPAHSCCARTAGGGDPGFRSTHQQSQLTITKI